MEILRGVLEVAPWSKTGRPWDGQGAPRALAARGHAVSVLTPRATGRSIRRRTGSSRCTARSTRGEAATLWTSGSAPVFFVEHERFGSRRGSTPTGTTTPTTPSGSRTQCRAALAARLRAGPASARHPRELLADRAHPVPAPARQPARSRPRRRAHGVTIHSLAARGIFSKHVVPALGLPWDVFRYEAMEFHDQLTSSMGSSSPTRSRPSRRRTREITTPEGGVGLDTLLRHARAISTGS